MTKKLQPYAVTFVVDNTKGTGPKEMNLVYTNKTILDKRYYTQPEVDDMLQGQVNNFYDLLYDSTSVLNVQYPPKEFTHDRFIVGFELDSYPLTTSRGYSYSARNARHIWNNWDTHYSKCRVRLECDTTRQTFTSPITGFATKTELYTWINSVVPNNGSQITENVALTIFDDEVGDIPSIQKIRGCNMTYIGLTSSKKWRKSETRTASATRDSAGTRELIIEASQFFVNKGLISEPITTTQYNSGGDNSKRVIWFSGRKNNLFGLPKIGSNITLPDQVTLDNRCWWDMSTDAPVSQVVTDTGGHILQDFCYVCRTFQGNIEAVRSDSIDMRSKLFQQSDESIIVVYLVRNSVDSNKYALFAKPLGIDLVYVDWFDQTKYRLEAIGSTKERQSQLRYLPCSTGTRNSDLIGDRSAVYKSTWMWNDMTPSQVNNAGFLKPRSIRFRLRRLSDNRVGSLSKASIKPVFRTTNALFKWMVY